MNSDKEIWKTIPGYSDYMVSDQGRVKSFKYKEPRILKSSIDGNGYSRIGFKKDGKKKVWKIHKLVALTFLDYIPDGNRYINVDHINGIKSDNRLENLRIITSRENTSLGYLRKKTSSKYTGVSWHPQSKKWTANIYFNCKRIYIGIFPTEEQAGQAYQDKLKELNGLRD